jgi:molecular chaperone GrpE
MEDDKKKKPAAQKTASEPEVKEDWKDKAEEYLEGWKRAKADLENFEKRSQEEMLASVKYANKKLILEILPVLDNYDRAFDSIKEEDRGNAWVKGFEYIKTQLETILANNGVVRFESRGKKFDPHFHESIATVAGEKDVVVEEVVSGYTMGEKVIRHAKVKVGNGEVNAAK